MSLFRLFTSKMLYLALTYALRAQNPLHIVDLVAAAELVLLILRDDLTSPVVDEHGEMALQVLMSIGMPSVAAVLQGTEGKTQKEVSEAKKRGLEGLKKHVSIELRWHEIVGSEGPQTYLSSLYSHSVSQPLPGQQFGKNKETVAYRCFYMQGRNLCLW